MARLLLPAEVQVPVPTEDEGQIIHAEIKTHVATTTEVEVLTLLPPPPLSSRAPLGRASYFLLKYRPRPMLLLRRLITRPLRGRASYSMRYLLGRSCLKRFSLGSRSLPLLRIPPGSGTVLLRSRSLPPPWKTALQPRPLERTCLERSLTFPLRTRHLLMPLLALSLLRASHGLSTSRLRAVHELSKH